MKSEPFERTVNRMFLTWFIGSVAITLLMVGGYWFAVFVQWVWSLI